MPEEQTEWQSIAIPKKMYQRIKRVIVFTGHPSVPETILQAIQKHYVKGTFCATLYRLLRCRTISKYAGGILTRQAGIR